MTTTLAVNRVELSKQMGDYWASATTSAGAAGGTTLVDTGLKAKLNDWIPDEAYTLITEAAHAAINEERHITALANSTGTLTVLAHSVQIGSGVDYEVHRLFTATEKMRALVQAARDIFPYGFKQIRNETLTSGNWLRRGDLETYTSNVPDSWTASTGLTTAQNTTKLYIKRGAASCTLTYGSGTPFLYQDQATILDWLEMAGYTITLSGWVWSDTASQVRLAIYDGTTTTYSSYHTGGSSFEWLDVSASIPDQPKEIEFRVYCAKAGNAYVDDLRAIGSMRRKLNVDDLNLALDYPHRIFRQRHGGAEGGDDIEPWIEVKGYRIGSDGYVYLPASVPEDYKLRVIGINYLDFGNGTAWTDTVDIDSPQTDILIAQAIINLCEQRVFPVDSSSKGQQWERALAYWRGALQERKQRLAMILPAIPIHHATDY